MTTNALFIQRPASLATVLRTTIVALALASAALAEPAPAPLVVGDALPALGLRDQHGADASIDPSTALLLFTRDMNGGGFVKDTLAEGGAEKLAAAKAVYVSDVSGMPGPIRNMFALPSIRKRPYRVVIDETGTATARLPYRQDAVTMLTLESGKITAIDFATSIEAVKSRLGVKP